MWRCRKGCNERGPPHIRCCRQTSSKHDPNVGRAVRQPKISSSHHPKGPGVFAKRVALGRHTSDGIVMNRSPSATVDECYASCGALQKELGCTHGGDKSWKCRRCLSCRLARARESADHRSLTRRRQTLGRAKHGVEPALVCNYCILSRC